MAMQKCRGGCGTIFIDDLVPSYEDGYCKDCFINKLKLQVEYLERKVAGMENLIRDMQDSELGKRALV